MWLLKRVVEVVVVAPRPLFEQEQEQTSLVEVVDCTETDPMNPNLWIVGVLLIPADCGVEWCVSDVLWTVDQETSLEMDFEY